MKEINRNNHDDPGNGKTETLSCSRTEKKKQVSSEWSFFPINTLRLHMQQNPFFVSIIYLFISKTLIYLRAVFLILINVKILNDNEY